MCCKATRAAAGASWWAACKGCIPVVRAALCAFKVALSAIGAICRATAAHKAPQQSGRPRLPESLRAGASGRCKTLVPSTGNVVDVVMQDPEELKAEGSMHSAAPTAGMLCISVYLFHYGTGGPGSSPIH